MPDIRPPSRSLVPTQPAAARPGEAARSAAQRAFFEAAIGKTPAPAAPPAVTAQTAAPRVETVQVKTVPDEPPTRYLRPGSLLDIKV